MPLIEIEVFENEFSHEQRTGIINAVTNAMVAFTGESIRPHTWVVLEEIKSGNWGHRRQRTRVDRRTRPPGASPCRPHDASRRPLTGPGVSERDEQIVCFARRRRPGRPQGDPRSA